MSQSRKRRAPIQVEALEGKQLLSTVHIAAPVHHGHVQQLAARPISLEGRLQTPIASIQTYVSNLGHHVGTFTLSGRLGSLGPVHGTYVATLDATEQVMQSGFVSLSNRRGSVLLSLAADPADPTSYRYTVTTGSGAFASATGAGKLTTVGPTANGKSLIFHVHAT